MARKLRIAAILAVGLPLLAVALYLAYMTATDFRPPAEMPLATCRNAAAILERGVPFSVATFNIGYAGMDAGADFFMDGGRGSGSRSLEATRANLRGITSFLAGENPDLALLQEVDRRAKRSHRLDEAAAIEEAMAAHGSVFAVNYKVPWVPVPLARPMGGVHSGLLTLSRFRVAAATRRQLPGSEAWPRQLAELDRCLGECRIPLSGGGELVLVNLHLSVFDRGGMIRRQQLAYLRELLLAERRRGNPVIAGGDWNHGLPGSDPKRFRWTSERPGWYMDLPPDFTPPGYAWVLDATRPTIRASATAYRQGESFVAVIDGFLVSEDIEVRGVAVRDLGFRDSDHNPVVAAFAVRQSGDAVRSPDGGRQQPASTARRSPSAGQGEEGG